MEKMHHLNRPNSAPLKRTSSQLLQSGAEKRPVSADCAKRNSLRQKLSDFNPQTLSKLSRRSVKSSGAKAASTGKAAASENEKTQAKADIDALVKMLTKMLERFAEQSREVANMADQMSANIKKSIMGQ